MEPKNNEPIAIVGIGCRFPGDATSPSKLWHLLREPKDIAKRIPSDRFNLDRFYHPDGSHHGTTNVKESYFLDQDLRHFDSGFFGIPSAEALAMDPQHRLLLETVYESLEAAGMPIGDLRGSDTAASGVARSNSSARISYHFDWHGPSMTIDTACSSSLVAVHQAVQTLRSGTSRLAIAAGANLLLAPLGYIMASNLKMLSPTSRSRMWDVDADGYARGEGIAALVLKPLSAALADGDMIEGVIRETGINQDGKTKGITMPSASVQSKLIREVYARAGLDINVKKDRCQYFEAHGTGTPAGDPQEAEALHAAFFGQGTHEDDEVLPVGSIKTIVVGHTEGTAGIAGIIKACLAMKHGLIPPNLHHTKLSPAIEPFYKHLQLVTTLQAWPEVAENEPRRASVNSFGFGGTNAHAIIESYSPPKQDNSNASNDVFLPFNFSASSDTSLKTFLEGFRDYLSSTPVNLRRLSYTLCCRRSELSHKLSLAASSQEELLSKIETFLSSGKSSTTPSTEKASILAIFTGQGAQWPRMGAQLLQTIPQARALIQTLDESLQSLPEPDKPSWTIYDELIKDQTTSRLDKAFIAQPLAAAVQMLIVHILTTAGITFRAIVGHSSGEIVAAYAAGLVGLRDAIRIAYYRGLHSELAQGREGQLGAMLAVGTSHQDAKEMCELEEFAGHVTIAAVNSSNSLTISGDEDAINEIQALFEEEGKFVRRLKVDKAYHSHHMEAAAGPFLSSLKACGITVTEPPSSGSPTWFSSVYSNTQNGPHTALQGPYWIDNLNGTVMFAHAVENALASADYDLVVEVGPHAALKRPTSDIIAAVTGSQLPYTETLSRGMNDIKSLVEAIGFVWANTGSPSAVDFASLQALLGHNNQSMIQDMPPYQWDHSISTLWAESSYSKLQRQHPGHFHELLGSRVADGAEGEWRWRNVLVIKEIPWLAEHGLQGSVVFPATGFICLALEAALQMAHEQQSNKLVSLLEVEDMIIHKAIVIDPDQGPDVRVSVTSIKEGEDVITASFACFSTATRGSTRLALSATASIKIYKGEPVLDILGPRGRVPHGLVPIDAQNFYEELEAIGYNYGPTFRGMKEMHRKTGTSHGIIEQTPHGFHSDPICHPALLDAALQSMLCGFSHPGDGSIWSLHAPLSFRRVSLVPPLCGTNMTRQVVFACSIHEYDTMEADVELFQSDETNHKSISIEGARFGPLAAPTAADDRHLFAHAVWRADAPDGELASGGQRATTDEIAKGYDIERVAYYYLRTLRASMTRAQLQLPSHHEALLDWADHVCGQVAKAEHAYVTPDWNADSHELITELIQKHGINDPYMAMLHATGEALPSVLRGETTILEHMTLDNKLDNFYKFGLGFAQQNLAIGRMVKQISHRYAHMNICEIGAGTGGATESILRELGDAFSSYTYTDISSGFFAQAQETFAAHRDRLIFKTLDISGDPVEQGFDEHAYDLIVASNVLHATPDLTKTVSNVRRLLKPGGFLVMMEFTDSGSVRLGLAMGGLPGWWVGRETGRRYSPTITMPEWNGILLQSGFAGVDASTPNPDPVVMAPCIMVAQAIDEHITALRTPLEATVSNVFSTAPALVILGDSLAYELPTTPLEFLDLESPYAIDPQVVASRLMRLEVSERMRQENTLGSCLWTVEPEVSIRNSRTLIPRIYPEAEQNMRYNSQKREIYRQVMLDDAITTLSWDGNKYNCIEEKECRIPAKSGHRRVKVQCSLLPSFATTAGYLYFSLGLDMDTNETVLAVSTRNSSAISVPEAWTIPVSDDVVGVVYLPMLAAVIMMERISSLVSNGATVVVFQAHTALAPLLEAELAKRNCRVVFLGTHEQIKGRRNWVHLHPHLPDRQLRAALPARTSYYFDLSKAAFPRVNLVSRIEAHLPKQCAKYDVSLLLALDDPTGLEGIHTLPEQLKRAHEVASTQFSPDGVPPQVTPISQVTGDNKVGEEPMRLVQWDYDSLVPVRIQPITTRSDLFLPGRTYWLAGLSGDLGQSLVNFMVGHGAQSIALSSRNPREDVEWVKELAAKGATVRYFKGDLSIRHDVERIYSEITTTLGPIAGVANGAMVLRDRGFVNMDVATIHEGTRGKVEGTQHLNDILVSNDLDWFIAFSSLSATGGNMGQMAYAAANNFMKALVAQRRARGLAGSVIDISQVVGVGYIEREAKLGTTIKSEQAHRMKHKSGTLPMSGMDLCHLFAEAIVAGRPGSTADPELITGIKTITPAEASEVLWGNNVRLGHFIKARSAADSLTGAAANTTTTAPVRKQLQDATEQGQAVEIIQKALIEKIKVSLMAQSETLSPKTPLIDLGVDSLVAVEIRTWFSDEVGVDVAVLHILDGPSVEDLARDAAAKIAQQWDVAVTGAEDAASNVLVDRSDTNGAEGLSTPASTIDGSETGAAEDFDKNSSG
ncbi:putative polyketide synthase [Stachybotrys elegans]|uniref:Polyketide synthase n=1 Tax=Stachybotrys elegans TaxID=80388 RepID=A0A8K0WIP3_9HYPO|nr:putative polyketide synthase [Stachybotrys elegans]